LEQKSQGNKILIADDSESSRDLLRFILQRFGCEVLEARDGQEALKLATFSNPDLLILDLNMPVLDGYSVASELRKLPAFATTPILALSAGPSETDVERLKEAGFSLFLKKPIAPATLRACIAQHLDVAAKG
jgi:two-component system chemotaxis response regulator CheY